MQPAKYIQIQILQKIEKMQRKDHEDQIDFMDKISRKHSEENDNFIMSFSDKKIFTNAIKSSPTFNKTINKNPTFAEDTNQSGQFQTSQKSNFSRSKPRKLSIAKTNKKISQQNESSKSQKYSPEIVELLQNCKSSIKSLQKQVESKNQVIQKLQLQNDSLTNKLKQSEKQIQRLHQILNLYIKQAQQSTNSQSQLSDRFLKEPQKQLTLNNQKQVQKLQLQTQKQINQRLIQQNNSLYQQNHTLKNEIRNLNFQNINLQQKIFKMGKGVGKALSTIKKNNLTSTLNDDLQINKTFDISQGKNNKHRTNGKITIKSPALFSQRKITFQTPLKNIQCRSIQTSDRKQQSTPYKRDSNLNNFSAQKCERKLEQISINAKRFDQIEKIQGLLNRMQELSKKQDHSEDEFV